MMLRNSTCSISKYYYKVDRDTCFALELGENVGKKTKMLQSVSFPAAAEGLVDVR